MGGSFIAIATMMSLFAFLIVAYPLLPPNRHPDKGFASLPLLSVIVVIVFAIGMYFALGRPDATTVKSKSHAADRIPQSRNVQPTPNRSVGSVASMIDGLSARLAREPDDADGWILLAKSYKHLGRREDAQAAYSRAKSLGKSEHSLDEFLKTVATSPGTDAEVRGTVSISSSAAARLDDSDTIFVVAKAVGGSPMPLAVQRRAVSELPFEFTLNDESSMVPGMGLSSADRVIVSVKVSSTGDALQVEDGFEVHSDPIDARNSEYLELVIDPDAKAPAIDTGQASSTL